MEGKFSKHFGNFSDGLCDLVEISFSISQSIEAGLQSAEIEVLKQKIEDAEDGYTCYIPYFSAIDEAMVVAAFAANTICDRQTGNGVGWGACGILEISATGCEYQTSGGLIVGWEVDSSDYQGYREVDRDSKNTNSYTFWIIHPDGENIRQDSTLRKAAVEMGWNEDE